MFHTLRITVIFFATLCSLLVSTGCGKDMMVESTLSIEPRGKTTLQLIPDIATKVEIANRGAGMVSVSTFDINNHWTSKINLGKHSRYKAPMHETKSVVIENLSDDTVTIDYIVHGRNGAGIEQQRPEPAAPVED